MESTCTKGSSVFLVERIIVPLQIDLCVLQLMLRCLARIEENWHDCVYDIGHHKFLFSFYLFISISSPARSAQSYC